MLIDNMLAQAMPSTLLAKQLRQHLLHSSQFDSDVVRRMDSEELRTLETTGRCKEMGMTAA